MLESFVRLTARRAAKTISAGISPAFMGNLPMLCDHRKNKSGGENSTVLFRIHRMRRLSAEARSKGQEVHLLEPIVAAA
jgi:hypothetical protein